MIPKNRVFRIPRELLVLHSVFCHHGADCTIASCRLSKELHRDAVAACKEGKSIIPSLSELALSAS